MGLGWGWGWGNAKRRQGWGLLFKELDSNKHDCVDTRKLLQGLAWLGGGHPDHSTQQGISPEGDTDPDDGLDLEEFILYLQEREQRLLLLFHSLDRNQDGKAQGWGCGALGDPNGVRTGSARRKRGGPLLHDDSQAISGALLTLS